ncbi:MAG: hypothetical protein U0174_13480 [Polyangiaceae bacterium]
MLKRRPVLLAAGLLLSAAVAPFLFWHSKAQGSPGEATSTRASAPSFPEVIVVATPHDAEAEASEVRRIVPGASAKASDVLGVIHHPAQSVIRGDATQDGATAFVVADSEAHDFGARLYRVDGKVADLGGGVLHASRPLVSENGFVYVERGKAGSQLVDADGKASMRVDRLTIDEIRPLESSPRFRTVFSAEGYALHLAGEWQGKLVVYRVDPNGAAIVLVSRDGSSVKEVARIPSFARDFSVHDTRLVFSNRSPDDTHVWHVVELSLESGTSQVLATQRDDSVSPFALAKRTLMGTALRTGLVEVPRAGSATNGNAPELRAPAGAGYYQVVDVTPSESQWVVSFVPSVPPLFDQTWAIDESRNVSVRLGNGSERVEVLRVVSSRTGGVR